MNNTWRTIVSITSAALLILKLIIHFNRPTTMAEHIKQDFEPYWQHPNSLLEGVLTKAIVNKYHTDFSTLYIKHNSDDGYESVVACTSDGDKFQYFIHNLSRGTLDSLSGDGLAKPVDR